MLGKLSENFSKLGFSSKNDSTENTEVNAMIDTDLVQG
jgi:hypothetical protein